MFVCIARTKVAWERLLTAAQHALGRSISASVDAAGLPLDDEASFVCALSEFNRPGKDAVRQLREDALVRKHVTFTFLVNVPRSEFFTLSSLGLAVTPADVGEFAIVSGRLSEWVQALVDGTQLIAIRRFSCLMLSWFEKENLGEAWASWEKEHLPDEGMYRLVRKS